MQNKVFVGRDIIMTGLQSWDSNIGSNAIDIARELSKNNRVLYVDYALDRITLLRERKSEAMKARMAYVKSSGSNVAQVQDNLWSLKPKTVLESINKIPFKGLFNQVNKINNKRFAKEIRRGMEELSFKDPILFVDNDFTRSIYLKELLPHDFSIYYLRDNMTGQDYFKQHGPRLEKEMMTKSDFVMANSAYLADYARESNPQSYDSGQGFDMSKFSGDHIQQRPEDLSAIKGPIIGYLGALISMRLDIALLEQIAQAKPEWQLVLVGPQDDDFKASALHQMDNVHLMGHRPVDQAPNYINAFDVCINPQAINYMTIGNYPRKIDEYLCLGKPTVATKTKTMEAFAEHTYLCENATDYIQNIEKALAENSEEKAAARREFALSHTWENSIKRMSEGIVASRS